MTIRGLSCRKKSFNKIFVALAVLVYSFGGFFLIFVFLLFITHASKLFWYRQKAKFQFERIEERSGANVYSPDARPNSEKISFAKIFASEILVATDGGTENEIPKIRKYRTTNDSIIEEIEKEGLLEANYVGEMEYSPNKARTQKSYFKGLISRFWYKPPSQGQACKLVMRQMMRDKLE